MSSIKYFCISNQKGVIIEVDNLVILHSAAHSLGFRNYLPTAGVTLRPPPACSLPLLRSFGYSLPSTQGLRFAHHLPVVCHSFGVLVTLSHQHRGYASLTTCLWSATPSEFWLLSPINTGVTLRFTPACGLSALRACFSFSPSNKRNHRMNRIKTNPCTHPTA